MAFLNSDNYRLWIGDGAGTEAFAELAGQKGMDISFGSSKVDQTVKSDSYETARPGLLSVTLSVDLTPSLPDANGYTRLESQWKAKGATTLQIRKDGSAGDGSTDVVFAASMYVEGISDGFQPRTNATTKISFFLAAAPVTNTLAA